MTSQRSNVVLIGMPGVGKSTIGVLLAKEMGRYFLDTDVYIQAIENRRLQEIIDADGLDAFRRLEGEHLGCIDIENAVIATGGSAIYSEPAMENLRARGIIVHLDVPLEEIHRRVTDLQTRGLVMEPGQTLDTLYEKRMPLYRRWADVTVTCSGGSHQETLAKLINAINEQETSQ